MTATSRAAGPSRGRLLAFRLLALVGAPLLFFGALEGALRLAGSGFDPRFFVPVEGRRVLTTNPDFGLRFFAPAEARRPLVAEIPDPKPAEAYRVVVLGGSAALGIPDPAFSPGRILGVMLEDAGRGPVEVVNAAMTAINSHVVRVIAGELGRLEPDAVVISMGNNEVVGPWGLARAGGEGQAGPPDLTLLRASLTLRAGRVGQLGSRLLASLGRRQQQGWRGMEGLAGRRVGRDDPRLERVRSHFERNLAAILAAARSTGARVLVSTVAVDLLDTPPFASLEGGLGGAEKELFDDSRRRAAAALAPPPRGISELGAPELEAILADARRAVELDPGHAEARYLLGRALLLAGERGSAQAELEAARDLDALRFRADSAINAAVRRLAAEAQDARGDEEEGVVVAVDAAQRLARVSEAGVPGRKLFFEHVHLTFEGAYQVAASFFEALAPGEEPPSLERCAERLAFTDWHRLRQLRDIDAMMARPPFTGQLWHRERSASRRLRLQALRRRGATPEAVRRALEATRAAAERKPGDLQHQRQLAALLEEAGDPGKAAEVLRGLVERLPSAPGLWLDLGNALGEAGESGEAEVAYLRAGELDRHSADVPFNLGVLDVERRRFEAAVGHFEAALERDPGHGTARLNLAAALDELGRGDEALATYRRAVELAPGDPAPRLRLASALAARGEDEAAAALLEETVEGFPDDAVGHFEWALFLVGRGRSADAIRHFAAALRLEPDFVEARGNLVEVHNRLGAEAAARGDLASATTSFRKALAVHPDHAPSRYNLALALGRQGRVEDAVEQLREALALARASGHGELAREIERHLSALGRSGS